MSVMELRKAGYLLDEQGWLNVCTQKVALLYHY